MDVETIEVINNYSAIMSSIMVVKKEDLGEFTNPCTIRVQKFKKSLCDLEESINLIPFIMF